MSDNQGGQGNNSSSGGSKIFKYIMIGLVLLVFIVVAIIIVSSMYSGNGVKNMSKSAEGLKKDEKAAEESKKDEKLAESKIGSKEKSGKSESGEKLHGSSLRRDMESYLKQPTAISVE